MQQQITLTLTIPETNLVLDALGQLPYAHVYELVEKVRGQAHGQIGLAPVAGETA
ncbi:hypothetical protein GCM10022221_66360 [Actinocorallia aurea]